MEKPLISLSDRVIQASTSRSCVIVHKGTLLRVVGRYSFKPYPKSTRNKNSEFKFQIHLNIEVCHINRDERNLWTLGTVVKRLTMFQKIIYVRLIRVKDTFPQFKETILVIKFKGTIEQLGDKSKAQC